MQGNKVKYGLTNDSDRLESVIYIGTVVVGKDHMDTIVMN